MSLMKLHGGAVTVNVTHSLAPLLETPPVCLFCLALSIASLLLLHYFIFLAQAIWPLHGALTARAPSGHIMRGTYSNIQDKEPFQYLTRYIHSLRQAAWFQLPTH